MSFSKEVRTVIKFGMLVGKTAPTTHAEFVQVLGEEAPGLSTIKRWAAKFCEGVTDVKDAVQQHRQMRQLWSLWTVLCMKTVE